jgi:hypothetical protein
MANNPIAQVYVTVIPETSRVAADIKKALRELDPEMRRSGERWGKEIKDGIGPIKPEVKPETVSAKAELEKFRREEERKTIRQKIEFDEADWKRKLELMGKEFDGVGSKFASAGKFNLGLTGIGLIPAAATGIANLAGAVQQLAGAGLAVPGIFAGIASSLGTAALGAHGMGDALTAITKAADGTKASVAAADKALAGLSANQADVVKTVAGLKGTLTDLEHIAGQNMFAGVSDGLKGLVGNLLPAATRGIDGISRSLNQNLLQAMNSLGSGSSQGFLSRIFGNTGTAQGQLTSAIDPIIHAMGTLAAAGSDTLPRLATAVGNVADRFNRFITAADGDGRLAKWISQGITGFTQLGNIALNLGKSFTAITQAAGGGGGLLTMLQQATEKLQLFLNSDAGQSKLMEFFRRGRDQMGQLKDIAVELGPILGGVFNAGISAANLWLPVIREVLSDINSIPGGAQAVVTAFVAWKTIQGPVALLNSLTNVATMLKSTLPAAAAEGGAAAATGLNPLLAKNGVISAAIVAMPHIQDFENKNIPGASFLNGLPTPDNLIGDGSRVLQGGQSTVVGPRVTTAADQAQAARDAAVRAARDNAGKPGLFGNGLTGGTTAPTTSIFGGGIASTPPAVVLPPVALPSDVTVPGVSSYVAPVVTQGSGGGSAAAVNLPYTGTADPNAGIYSSGAVASNVYTGGTTSDTHGQLVPNAANLKQIIQQQFGITDIGGYRAPDGYNEHSSGQALDIMVGANKQLGDQVNQFLLKNAAALGIQYDLWQQTQWNPDGTTSGMSNRGSPTANHMDHVHARVRPGSPASGALSSPVSSMYPSTTSGTGLTSSDMSLRNAQERVNDTQHSEEQAQARMDELNAKGTATAKQREAAEYALAKAKREHKDAIDSLTIATDKYNKSSVQKAGKGGMNSDAQSLGTSFLSGIAQIFGLDGSVFADPTQFGLFNIFKSAMGLKFDPSQAAPGMGQPAGVAPAGGDFLQGILSSVPQPFGQPVVGSPNSPGPGNAGGPGGMDFRGATFGVNPQQWTEQIAGLQSSNNRYQPMLQNLPTP